MRTKLLVFLLVILLSTLSGTNIFAASKDDFPMTPTLNQGKKWRIGYLQGGDYGSYQKSLISMVEGLMNLGWIEKDTISIPADSKDTKQLWKWLATSARSKFIQFVPDAYYSSDWDKKVRPLTRAKVFERLNGKKDLDLMLALGTWAGQDLANNKHHIPTLVASTTDPLAAKIIMSVEDSGYDHIHAKIDPARHQRQVRLFHDIIGFEKLGVVYENSEEGRGFGAIQSVEAVSREAGFEILACHTPFNDVSQQAAEQGVVACYEKLASRVDAVYIARHPGVNLKNLPYILAPLNGHQIPTFAQGLSEEVKHGVLLSISLADFCYIGDFYARTIAKIFNGAKPRQLRQEFQNPPKIAINLKTAQMIGYDPPIDILGAADEIYEEISVAR